MDVVVVGPPHSEQAGWCLEVLSVFMHPSVL
jgi:hypothetical protein